MCSNRQFVCCVRVIIHIWYIWSRLCEWLARGASESRNAYSPYCVQTNEFFLRCFDGAWMWISGVQGQICQPKYNCANWLRFRNIEMLTAMRLIHLSIVDRTIFLWYYFFSSVYLLYGIWMRRPLTIYQKRLNYFFFSSIKSNIFIIIIKIEQRFRRLLSNICANFMVL